jgi:hypothetical protein
MRTVSVILVVAAVSLLVGGCAPTPAERGSPSASANAVASSPTPAASRDPWAGDLSLLNGQVRALHPDPFAINPQSAWVAKLAELQQTLPGATPDQRIVQFASLVGLLDTHSSLSGPFHSYDVLVYPFKDGWFVVRAKDPTLVGSKLVSVGGHPTADIEAAMRPLVPADNESGKLDGLQGLMTTVEFLHGLGIVDDPAKPGFVFERADGTQVTVDLTSSEQSMWELQLGIIGDLLGDAPEAVARRGEATWARLDKGTKTFLIGYNDYTETGLTKPLAAMKAALDNGAATRVILDMRYLRGGDGSLAQPLIDALVSDKRINRPGGLIVLTGRENVSAGTVVAGALDRETKATLIGEMTPARADNFLCECSDIFLPESRLTVTVPTQFLGNGDPRPAVEPDIPFALTAADFFAGKDPALELALKSRPPAP